MRAFISALLGVWLGLSIAAWWIAGTNFAVLGPRLRNQDVVFQKLPEGERVPALRYAASELNRRVFATYAVLQATLLVAVGALIARERGGGKWAIAALALVAVVVIGELVATPAIVSLGREIDFLPREPEPEPVHRFKLFHAVYVSADLAKMVALVVLAVALARRPAPAPSS